MDASVVGGLPVACNRDCGATCALVAQELSAGSYRLARNPLNQALKRPCPRGLRGIESRNAPDRLTEPLIRTGNRGSGTFKPISWDEAIHAVAERMSEVVSAHGHESILNMGGSGACKGALHNTGRLVSRFLNQLGPVTTMRGSYSFQAAGTVLPYAYGSAAIGYDARTLLDTRFVILWGANIADTRFGNESEQVIRHIKAQGGEVVVLDPRRTRTAGECGTEWIPILPGTDSAAMLALAWTLIEEGLVDADFISTHVHGYQELHNYICGEVDGVQKDPEWAAPICGIPSEVLRNLAIRYGTADPAALVPGFSIQRTLGGEDAYRMSVALQAMTGNTGKAGGTPGTNMWFGLPGPSIQPLAAPPSTGGVISKATWPEALLGGKASGFGADIKAAYVTGTNYLNQGSDIGRNIEAFESLDLIVCHELFLTPTARYADIILPATHYLEREDVIIPSDNYLYYSAKIFDPVGQARDDFDIFADISRALGNEDEFTEGRGKREWIDSIIDGSAVTSAGRDEFKQCGIFDGGEHQRYGLKQYIDDPTGHPLPTPSGRIEISSEMYAETGFPAWPIHRALPVDTNHPLRLISPHSRFRINSTGSNIKWVKDRDPIRLWMNPVDAKALGIDDGALVRVKSDVGKMDVRVAVTDDIMAGVVSCSEGGWLGNDGDSAVNLLTPLEPTLPSCGTRTHTVNVSVEAKK